MKTLYKSLLLILVIGSGLPAFSQQRIHFSQYVVNQYILNPAAGGIDGDMNLAVGYRKQWVNFNGGPLTYYFTGNVPIKVNRRPDNRKPSPFHSAGIVFFNDKTGPVSKTSLLASYSYNLPVTRNYRLAAGIFAGITEVRLDQSELKFDQPGEVFNYSKVSVPDGSFGLWFYNDKFYLGSSVNQVFYNSLHFLESDSRLAFHYYLTSGYRIPLSYSSADRRSDNNYLVPSIMLKYGGWGTSPSVDLNLKLNFLEHFWIGSSYRRLDAVAFLIGIKCQGIDTGMFELVYSYDYTLSKINSYTSGSHEITLKYNYMVKQLICPSAFW